MNLLGIEPRTLTDLNANIEDFNPHECERHVITTTPQIRVLQFSPKYAVLYPLHSADAYNRPRVAPRQL